MPVLILKDLRGTQASNCESRVKARAIVDSVYRSQSRGAMWIWITVGLLAAVGLFGGGMLFGLPVAMAIE